jgi:hypothetical protein
MGAVQTPPRRTRAGLAAAFLLLWLGAAGMIAVAALRAVQTIRAERWAAVPPFTEWSPLPVAGMPQFSFAEVNGRTIMAEEISVPVRWFSAAPSLLLIVMLVVTAVALGEIFRHVHAGDFFHPGVVRALRVIAVVLIGGAILHGLLDDAAWDAIAKEVAAVQERLSGPGTSEGGISLDKPDLQLGLILLGAVAGALAIAFRRGGELAEEAEGVV